jgi:hypothetical protein
MNRVQESLEGPNPLYGGRGWLKSSNNELPSDIKTSGRLKIVSYNVLADCKMSNIRYSTTKSWENRCTTLIREIQSYEADIGRPNRRQVHSCCLASAYESYTSGGEPYFTTSAPLDAGGKGVCCMDYIFYSSNCCITTRILSLPQLNMLKGETPNDTVSCSNKYWNNPIPPVRSLFVTQSTIQNTFPTSRDSKNLKELINKSIMAPYNISPGNNDPKTHPNDSTSILNQSSMVC